MQSNVLTAPELYDAPRLRLLPRRECGAAADASRAERRPVRMRAHLRLLPAARANDARAVLVVGQDPAQRAALLAELSQALPVDTTFEQAGTFSQLLVRAPASSIVILSSELADIPPVSLTHVLARRNPDLPVVRLDSAVPRDNIPAGL